MTVREDIKCLLARKSCTMTEIAEKMTLVSGKKYTLKTLSQKLANGTLRYDEFKIIVNILGYKIELVDKE